MTNTDREFWFEYGQIMSIFYIFFNDWNSFGYFVLYWMFYLLSHSNIDLIYVVIFIKDLKTQLMFKLTCDRSDDAVDLTFAKPRQT